VSVFWVVIAGANLTISHCIVTGVPMGEVRGCGSNPPLNVRVFLIVRMFNNDNVEALLLYSLNPKFCTGKR